MASALYELLAESASRWPDAEAVVFRQQRLTYRDLDEASSRLATALRGAGLARGGRVGLYLDKSPESIVAMFGVLKAGAAYVPLDTSAPTGRLGYMLRNSGATALITTESKQGALGELLAGSDVETVVCIDGGLELDGTQVLDADALAEASKQVPGIAVSTDELAYILYTSGSTGEPKGVMITHGNALAFIDWAAETFGVGPGDRVANHAPLHFDLSVFDVFVSLKMGATLCPVPVEASRFPIELARFISEQGITVWYSVPSALVLLVQRGKLDSWDLSKLRAVLFAGEVFPPKHLGALMTALPGTRYYNLYGPTETNVVTYAEVTEPPADDRPASIGRACSGADVFALNEGGMVAEEGETGELHVAGPTVALGYCGDEEKTARLFVDDPRQGKTGRVYRTGDLVRQGESGDYHFLGRVDQQVKVQGYRIELGEVESALLSHPSIHEAVVVALEHERIGTYLKAFVVAGGGQTLAVDELKTHVGKVLPPYMTPGAIEFLPVLPKTANGKIDRVALASRR